MDIGKLDNNFSPDGDPQPSTCTQKLPEGVMFTCSHFNDAEPEWSSIPDGSLGLMCSKETIAEGVQKPMLYKSTQSSRFWGEPLPRWRRALNAVRRLFRR